MADDDLRLPPFFPRVPKECKEVSAKFFDCFSTAADYTPDKEPGVARQALVKCKQEMKAYDACASKFMTARQKELVQAPQVYLEQAKTEA